MGSLDAILVPWKIIVCAEGVVMCMCVCVCETEREREKYIKKSKVIKQCSNIIHSVYSHKS